MMRALRYSLVPVMPRPWLAVCVALSAVFAISAAPAGAATLSSESAIARLHGATLEAHVNPEGHDTTCQAQYVSEETYKQTGWSGAPTLPCSPEDLGSGSSAVAATVSLGELEISATYRYRFLLTSEGHTVPGPEETFATFGVEAFDFEALTAPTSFGLKGEPLGQEALVQAGAHPFELTTYIAANTTPYKGEAGVSPDAIIKDAIAQLPPGLIGNPTAMARCPGRLAEKKVDGCPIASEVGTITVYKGATKHGPDPLFDVIPPEGVAASFAGDINLSTDAYIDASVRSGSDYGVTAAGYNITALTNVTGFKIVLWGVPNATDHNRERLCPGGGTYIEGCSPEGLERPFLTLPTACNGPQTATASLDSYQAPGEYVSKSTQMPAITGCGNVGFKPAIEAKPTSTTADSPTGLNVELKIPQNENPTGQATADLKNAIVTFPAGMSVDPSSADGLETCSEEQVGFKHEFTELNPTGEPGVKTPQFTPNPAECPEGSKLGTVEIDTPLLEHPLPGGLYLAKQHENPFHSLLAVYLAVYDKASGVVVKLPGRVEACGSAGQVLEDGVTCGAPGQLSTVFEQNPQLPFEDLKVDLFPGPRAALTTPLTCGSYSTSTNLMPWSAPEGKNETPSSEPFTVAEAPGGGACAGSESAAPNTPGFTAGTASPIAGSYSPFVLHLLS